GTLTTRNQATDEVPAARRGGELDAAPWGHPPGPPRRQAPHDRDLPSRAARVVAASLSISQPGCHARGALLVPRLLQALVQGGFDGRGPVRLPRGGAAPELAARADLRRRSA